jgi:hypothetical protein
LQEFFGGWCWDEVNGKIEAYTIQQMVSNHLNKVDIIFTRNS